MANVRLDDIEVYARAMEIGEKVYNIIAAWTYFYRISMGRQLMESCDSIAANISEGYGRYFYKENRNFCYYARGSLTETKTWLVKAKQRNLICVEDYSSLIGELEILHLKLNNYINSIGKTPDKNQ